MNLTVPILIAILVALIEIFRRLGTIKLNQQYTISNQDTLADLLKDSLENQQGIIDNQVKMTKNQKIIVDHEENTNKLITDLIKIIIEK